MPTTENRRTDDQRGNRKKNSLITKKQDKGGLLHKKRKSPQTRTHLRLFNSKRQNNSILGKKGKGGRKTGVLGKGTEK